MRGVLHRIARAVRAKYRLLSFRAFGLPQTKYRYRRALGASFNIVIVARKVMNMQNPPRHANMGTRRHEPTNSGSTIMAKRFDQMWTLAHHLTWCRLQAFQGCV